METITKIIREIPVAFIKLYRLLLSPMLGPRCRFTPSCSEYAIESIRTHGVFKGAIYANYSYSKKGDADMNSLEFGLLF